MGVAAADRIAAALMDAGLSGTTPAAVVERGTLPEERCLRTTLHDLPGLIASAEVEAPALILVGEVARADKADSLPALAAAV